MFGIGYSIFSPVCCQPPAAFCQLLFAHCALRFASTSGFAAACAAMEQVDVAESHGPMRQQA
jgi:hypothetical protein